MNEQAHNRRKDVMGDNKKRVCRFYASCQNWTTEWEDETGSQEYCPVCEASIFIPVEELGD